MYSAGKIIPNDVIMDFESEPTGWSETDQNPGKNFSKSQMALQFGFNN